MSTPHFKDIDWNELWKQSRSEKSFQSKTVDDWDKKAPSFARRNSSSLYIEKFIELLDPDPSWSILDIASGPGTLAIPLAKKIKSIKEKACEILKILELDMVEPFTTLIQYDSFTLSKKPYVLFE